MDAGWVELGRTIRSARGRRWRRRADFADYTGLSYTTLGDIERGRRGNFSTETYAAIEDALNWEEGTCMRVARGGKVRPRIDPELQAVIDAWPHLPPVVKAMIKTAIAMTRRS